MQAELARSHAESVVSQHSEALKQAHGKIHDLQRSLKGAHLDAAASAEKQVQAAQESHKKDIDNALFGQACRFQQQAQQQRKNRSQAQEKQLAEQVRHTLALLALGMLTVPRASYGAACVVGWSERLFRQALNSVVTALAAFGWSL